MKTIQLFLFLVCAGYHGQAQNLAITLSNPAPRVGEVFEISIDFSDIKATLFKPLGEDFKMVDNFGYVGTTAMTQSFKATTAGTFVIDPISFVFNGVNYSTEKLEIEVAEALPDVAEGMWVRQVKINDGSFILIVEERRPIEAEKSKSNGNKSFGYSTEGIEYAKYTGNDIQIKSTRSSSRSEIGSFTNKKGETVMFSSSITIYNFTYEAEHGTTTIDADDFVNIPKGVKFDPVIIKW